MRPAPTIGAGLEPAMSVYGITLVAQCARGWVGTRKQRRPNGRC